MSWRDDDAVQAYADNQGIELEDVDQNEFNDAFRGLYDSTEDYARQLMDDLGELEPGSLAERYFDYEYFARDLETGGDIWTYKLPGRRGVYVFQSL